MNVSEMIAQKLAGIGVQQCFSIVGGHSLFLNQAFSQNASIKVTYMHNEQAMTMAADGYYRTSQLPAVVNVTAGPAALNCLNGVYGAYVDAIPMVIVSGNPKQKLLVGSTGQPLRQYGDQEFGNIIDVVRPITKYAIQLRSGMNFAYEIQKALYVASSGKPGPVWIDVPMDIQARIMDETAELEFLGEETKLQLQNRNGIISEHILDIILSKLLSSRRPLLYLGAQINTTGCDALVRQIVNLLQIPVVTSWNAHDLIESDNRFFVGRPGLRGERSGNFVTHSSDFILSIGSRLSIRQVGDQIDQFSPSSFKIMVDPDLHELRKPHLNIDLAVHASIPDFVQLFHKYLHKNNYQPRNEHSGWLQKAKTIFNNYKPQKHHYPELSKINPYHFLIDFFSFAPANTTIVCGNGITIVGTFQCANIKAEQDLFQNVGCASMGYDIPATIGAALGNNKNIICLTGDGSIQLNIQELSILKSLDRNVKIFVVNNNGYDSIKQSQKNVFGDDIKLHGVDEESGLCFPPLKKIAAAYNFDYLCITKENYGNFNLSVFEKYGDAIIEVFVSDSQSFEPKVGFVKNEDGTIKGDTLIDMSPKLSSQETQHVIKFLGSE
jgi:acetolactate synthase-1/2/3 large subunit